MGQSTSASRRQFVKSITGGAVASTLAGCSSLGGNGGGNGGGGGDELFLPGLYDLSGPTSEVGVPTANGSRDAFRYINDNDVLEWTIDHEWVDYSYDVAQARQAYDRFSSKNPPAMVGWGTPDTEALGPQFAEDEVVYVSASYAEKLMTSKFPYNFFGNLDYTSQNRALLKWIAENDPGATVAVVTLLNNPFGNQVVDPLESYVEGLNVDFADFINISITANSASSQMTKARNMDADYVIGHLTAAPMQVLVQARSSEYPEVELLGTTWAVDEIRTSESPELYEGIRFVDAFKTFEEVVGQDTKGAKAIKAAFEQYRDAGMDDRTVANLHYVRGFIHSLVHMRAIQHATESDDLDPTAGADLRRAMFEIDTWDVWGLAEPFDYRENDRRPTMTGRVYQVADGTPEYQTSVTLPRNMQWIRG